MGFFLSDIHRKTVELQKKLTNFYKGKSFPVYRGQDLSITDFDEVKKNKDGLVSLNSFLSTSKQREVFLGFVEVACKKKDTVGILFQISIDLSISSTPFAVISEVSDFVEEDKILF